ncbi:DUF4386 family protein [Fulvivirgaceae bacterium BMA10]|uniref:DUF4386 family protein n=1 Tax=Splendidivirga corallicola TaxID=3051826 RepID=A0ABT8KQ07_9BACT|nr:DUF4386 family protein [Fulvivirgaceae bacterium BMA10]
MLRFNINKKRFTGVLWILVVATILISLVITLKYDITLNIENVENTLQNVAIFPTPHVLELLFDTASSILLIVVGVALFILFKRKTTALLGSVWLVIAAIIMVVHNMGNFAITRIASEYVAAQGSLETSLKTSALTTLLIAKWGVTLASCFMILGVVTYSSLISKSSRSVGWFGIIAGCFGIPALMVGWMNTQWEMLGFGLWGPMLLWQSIFGIWLINKKTVIL